MARGCLSARRERSQAAFVTTKQKFDQINRCGSWSWHKLRSQSSTPAIPLFLQRQCFPLMFKQIFSDEPHMNTTSATTRAFLQYRTELSHSARAESILASRIKPVLLQKEPQVWSSTQQSMKCISIIYRIFKNDCDWEHCEENKTSHNFDIIILVPQAITQCFVKISPVTYYNLIDYHAWR